MIPKDNCSDMMLAIKEMWETGDNCIGDPHPCDLIGLETVERDELRNKIKYRNILDFNNEERKIKPIKTNDLYLVSDKLRNFLNKTEVMSFLHSTLKGKPILVSSLNVEYGTEQRTHADAIYSCPPKSNRHVTMWFALEDAHPDSGQVGYFAESHLFEPFIFSNGSRKIEGTIDRANGLFSRKTNVEAKDHYKDWLDYTLKNLGDQKPSYFDANIGDVMAWHGNLVHFGSKRMNPNITRKSIICFFHASEEYTENVIDFGAFDYLYKPPVPRTIITFI